ncbi:MAG TPA: CARDB domain-containing protein, partial [Chloroflexota bacterium]|nr:CARDB domain-containing protein [Chloroflexota bacterium]
MENRLLLATVNWISTSSGNWSDPTNWDSGLVPGPTDDAVIDVQGAMPTITIDSATQAVVNSIACSDPLAVAGGSLSVSANSTISGGLAMTAGGSLTASGLGVTCAVTGPTTASGASLYAQGGATLSLAKLTSYDNPTGSPTYLESTDAGSVLNLPALIGLGNVTGSLEIDASGGAQTLLPGLASIDTTSQAVQNVDVDADGAGTEIDLSGLAEFNCQAGSLTVTSGATMLLNTSLTSLSGVNVTLDGTGTIATDHWTSITDGGLTITGGSYPLTGLTDIDSSSLTASGGGSLTLAGVTSYADPLARTSFTATSVGSSLSLPALTDLDQLQSSLDLEASQGGQVVLPALALINTSTSTGYVDVIADGPGTQIDLRSLTSFNSPGGVFQVTNQAKVVGSKLTILNGVSVTLDGTGTQATNQWTALTAGALVIDGGSYTFGALADIDGSTINVGLGGRLTLPEVTSDTSPDFAGALDATGANSVLSLPALPSLSQLQGALSIDASEGAQILLPSVASINNTSQTVFVDINGEGTGTTIDLSGLTSFDSPGSSLTVTSGASFLDATLTGLNGVVVTLDGSGTMPISQWASLTDCSMTITGGSYSFTGLTDIDNSSLYAQTGGSLSLPAVTSYDNPLAETAFETTGFGSVLSLPALVFAATLPSYVEIDAYDGGQTLLPSVASINDTTPAVSNLGINADGSGSEIDLSGLASIEVGSGGLSVTNGATVSGGKLTSVTDLSVNVSSATLSLTSMTSAEGADFVVGAGAMLNFPAAIDFAGSQASATVIGTGAIEIGTTVMSVPAGGNGLTITVPQAPAGLALTWEPVGTFSGGTTFDVPVGTTVAPAGATFTGGVVFNVDAGATFDLTGGQTDSYGGTLTGSGAGTVQLSSGTLDVVLGGLTLNFPGQSFQWQGGVIDSAAGDLTNLGALNISGDDDKGFYDDGTLDNFGTIIQTGQGRLGLHSDGVAATTLEIEAGASYLIESDTGIYNPFGGQTTLDNAGVIRKTSGSGVSTLEIAATINNTGTIEADSGTLSFAAASFNQLTGNTLTGGTWNALDGATLEFPVGTGITTNAANVSLGGAGATIAAIAGLSSNSGSLSVTGGADFNTTGDFSNGGGLIVGAGSTVTVAGNATQTPAGTLEIQIGGPQASGLYGQLVVTGSATLGGDFALGLANAYNPMAGQDYPVLSFGSATGSFASLSGLPSGMTAMQSSTALDLDMGATGADLLPTSVTAPTSATDGQSITVNWHVSDQSPIAASGSWQDSVYLSATQAITSSSVLLGSEPHSGGLGANGMYNGSLTTTLPALSPAYYYVLVQVDSHFQVTDENRANNTLAATTGLLDISLPALTLGTAYIDSFTAADQNRYYQVSVSAGGSLSVAFTSTASSGAVALYVSQGSLPTPYGYQESAAAANQPSQTVAVPQVLAAGTYYVLAHSVSGNAATVGYTITATQSGGLAVSAISPDSGGDYGRVTIEIDGANFSPAMTASLTQGVTSLSATAIDFVSASQVFATF